MARGAAQIAADRSRDQRSWRRQDDTGQCVRVELPDGRSGGRARAGVRRGAGPAVCSVG